MSHQYWHHRLRADLEGHYEAETTLIALPPRYFSWRARGNSLSFAFNEGLNEEYDLVIATSMTDLSALKGMALNISRVPTILYFHENQFAYPDSLAEGQIERQLTGIYSAIAADRLVFNSHFNADTFFLGAEQLLRKMPDGVPKGVVQALQAKYQVISVPIDTGTRPRRSDSETLQVVWNHRWEFDKGLDDLLCLIELLGDHQMDFHLIGQKFRQVPKAIEQIRRQLGSRLATFGFIDSRADYLALLNKSDIVLSTAKQEFQGIAVLEAMAAGCRPIVPDSLAYKEFVPKQFRYKSLEQAASLLLDESLLLKPIDMPIAVTPPKVKNEWIGLVDGLVQ